MHPTLPLDSNIALVCAKSWNKSGCWGCLLSSCAECGVAKDGWERCELLGRCAGSRARGEEVDHGVPEPPLLLIYLRVDISRLLKVHLLV